MDFWDNNGLLNDRAQVTPTENRTLWTTEYGLLEILAGKSTPVTKFMISSALLKCYSLSEDRWYVDGTHKEFVDFGFSRDNAIAVASWGKLVNIKSMRECGCRFSWQYAQPQDIIYFYFCAGNWIAYLFLPFLCLNMIYSCWSLARCGNGELDTDGKLLAFVRCQANKGNILFDATWHIITEWILPKRLAKYYNLGIGKLYPVWPTIFGIYFKDPNHPNNILCKEIWK